MSFGWKTENMPKVSKRETKRAKEIVTVKDEGPVISSSTVHYSAEFAPGRFVVYSRFNDRDWVHIREYLIMGERTYPSKNGVCFTPGRLKALMNRFKEIDEQLRQQQEATAASSSATEDSFMDHLGV